MVERVDIEKSAHAPTEVRFSMRSLLVATALVAVTAAAFGTFLRLLPAEAQSRVLAFWAGLVLVTSLLIENRARKRLRAERQAGRVIMQLVTHSYFLPGAPRVATLISTTWILSVVLAGAVLTSVMFLFSDERLESWEVVPSVLWLLWYSFLIALGAAGGIAHLWWTRKVRIGEFGIVVVNDFLAWGQLRRHYWDACNRGVIVLIWEPHRTIAAKVPDELRTPQETLLQNSAGVRS